MLCNELVQKEMVECSQTSKNKEQKHKNKDYLKTQHLFFATIAHDETAYVSFLY